MYRAPEGSLGVGEWTLPQGPECHQCRLWWSSDHSRGTEGLMGLSVWCERKFTASLKIYLAKMLNLALIKSLKLTFSWQKMEGIKKQITVSGSNRQIQRVECTTVPVSLNQSVMKKKSEGHPRSGSTVDIYVQITPGHGARGAILCITGYWTAYLATNLQMPVAQPLATRCDN